MSTDNQSCLRFSLEESVWFQRGQEVAELISISLDPDITIQENEQYVTIKGSLELSGEYTCANVDVGEELEPQRAARQVHSVLERDEGKNEFLHRFPVDITIPRNRIESIYDINIQVESFDCDIPSRDSLKLSAELAITGLYGDQQHGSEEDISHEEDTTPVADLNPLTPQEPEPEPVWREPQVEQEAALDEDKVEVEIPSFKEFNVPLKEEAPVQETAQNQEPLYEPFRADAKKEPPASVEQEAEPVLSRNAQESPEEAPAPAPTRKEMPYMQHPVMGEMSPAEEEKPSETEPQPMETDAVVEQMEVDIPQIGPIINEKAKQEEEPEESSSSSSSSEESPKAKKSSKKKSKSLSIAEFLARKDETAVTTLRVCIVQQDDTLQQIAERYDVSAQQLINLNHLGLDQEVSEGQVLYVPAEYVEKR